MERTSAFTAAVPPGTATINSDIDVAIRVSEEKFNQILQEAFKNVKKGSGSSAEKTMLRALETGKIQRGEVKLSSLGKNLEKKFGTKIDISVVKIGGTFDQGPWITLK